MTLLLSEHESGMHRMRGDPESRDSNARVEIPMPKVEIPMSGAEILMSSRSPLGVNCLQLNS